MKSEENSVEFRLHSEFNESCNQCDIKVSSSIYR